MQKPNLISMKVDELKSFAKSQGLTGVDGLKKADLILAIESKLAEQSADLLSKDEPKEEPPKRSSSLKNDMQSHPKFAQFKKGVN